MHKMKFNIAGLLFLLLHLDYKQGSCQEERNTQKQNTSQNEKDDSVSSLLPSPQIHRGYPVVPPLALHLESPGSTDGNGIVDSFQSEELGSFAADPEMNDSENSYGERLEPRPVKISQWPSQTVTPSTPTEKPNLLSVSFQPLADTSGLLQQTQFSMVQSSGEHLSFPPEELQTAMSPQPQQPLLSDLTKKLLEDLPPQNTTAKSENIVPEPLTLPPQQPRQKLTYPFAQHTESLDDQTHIKNSTEEALELVPLTSPSDLLTQVTQSVAENSVSLHQPIQKLTYPIEEPPQSLERKPLRKNSTPAQESSTEVTQPVPLQSNSPRQILAYPTQLQETQPKLHNSMLERWDLSTLSSLDDSSEIITQSTLPPIQLRQTLTDPSVQPSNAGETQSQKNVSISNPEELISVSSSNESLALVTTPIQENLGSLPHQPWKILNYPLEEIYDSSADQLQHNNSNPETLVIMPLSAPRNGSTQVTQPISEHSTLPQQQPKQKLLYPILNPLHSENQLQQKSSSPGPVESLSLPFEPSTNSAQPIPELPVSPPLQPRKTLTHPILYPPNSENQLQVSSPEPAESLSSPLSSPREPSTSTAQPIPEHPVTLPHQRRPKLTYPVRKSSRLPKSEQRQQSLTSESANLPPESLQKLAYLTLDNSSQLPGQEILNSTLELSSPQPSNISLSLTQTSLEPSVVLILHQSLPAVDVSTDNVNPTSNPETVPQTMLPSILVELTDQIQVDELSVPPDVADLSRTSYIPKNPHLLKNRKKPQYTTEEEAPTSLVEDVEIPIAAPQVVNQSDELQTADVTTLNQDSVTLKVTNEQNRSDSFIVPSPEPLPLPKPLAEQREEVLPYVIQKRIDIEPLDSSTVAHINLIHSKALNSIKLPILPPIPISRLKYPIVRPVPPLQQQTKPQPVVVVTTQKDAIHSYPEIQTSGQQSHQSEYSKADQLGASAKYSLKETEDIEGYQRTLYVDYPKLSDLPNTSFNCKDKPYPGYYADVEAGCQVFHVCQKDGRQDSFLCPNGSIFHQQFFVCDWLYNVDCAVSPDYYTLNKEIGKINLNLMSKDLDTSLVSKY